MRYSDMRAMQHETGVLLDKKRLGKNQKARLATLIDQLDVVKQPPPTPPIPNTGERGDFQGNVYAQHWRQTPALREMRRNSKFGLTQCKPMRSRIQRTARKRRTGGVK